MKDRQMVSEDPGQFADVPFHAGLICINGPDGMTAELQRELFRGRTRWNRRCGAARKRGHRRRSRVFGRWFHH